MAITKTLVVNGVTGTFWVTEQIQLAPNLGQSKAVLSLYASQSAYLSGGAAIVREEFDLQNQNNPLQRQHLAGLVEAKLVGMSGILNGGSLVTGI